jgi:hypothetical protein
MNFKAIVARLDNPHANVIRGDVVDFLHIEAFEGKEVEKVKGHFVRINVTDSALNEEELDALFEKKRLAEPKQGSGIYNALDSTGTMTVPFSVLQQFLVDK